MQESTIEKYLKKKVEQNGGKALKINSASMSGLPDRMVLLPGGKIFFIEMKAPGKKPRPLQLACHRLLQNLGFDVLVIDSKEGVEAFIQNISEKR